MDAHDEPTNPRPEQRGPGVSRPAKAPVGPDPLEPSSAQDPAAEQDPAPLDRDETAADQHTSPAGATTADEDAAPEPGAARDEGATADRGTAPGGDAVADRRTGRQGDETAAPGIPAQAGSAAADTPSGTTGAPADAANVPADAAHAPAAVAVHVADTDAGVGPASGTEPDTARNDTDGIRSAPGTGPGVSGLPFRYQVVAAVVLAAIGVITCVHLGMVFFSVAPENTMTKHHGDLIDDWVLPEFEQNWKLFAPNPLQQNIAVQARAEVVASGKSRTTRWYNISAMDGAAINGNLLPSHTQQNELRRAWDFFLSTHDNDNRPTGMRGELSEGYLHRIIVLRLHRLGVGAVPRADGTKASTTQGTIMRVQIRAVTAAVQPPPWSGNAPVQDKPYYRTLAWWQVTPDDVPLGIGEEATDTGHSKSARTEVEPR